MDFTASALYGTPAPPQPLPAGPAAMAAAAAGGADHASRVAHFALTEQPPGRFWGNPTVFLVLVLAVAVLLVQFSVRVEVSG